MSGRASSYEAVWTTAGMVTKTPGRRPGLPRQLPRQGRPSLRRREDLPVACRRNPPAKQFWSVTLYDLDTRQFIENQEQIVDRSSHQPDLAKNDDGSVDIYFAPTAPKGFEKNWIQTVLGKSWFTYLRLYAPTEAYFDKSWPLPDIEQVK